MKHINGNKRIWEVVFQQELAKLYSSRFQHTSKLEITPFMAVLRMVKVEFCETKPELYRLLVHILHDYDPKDGQNAYDKTVRYIRIILDSVPELSEYIISVLPPPGDTTVVKSLELSHSLLQVVQACNSTEDTVESDKDRSRCVGGVKTAVEGNVNLDVAAEISDKRGKKDAKFYNYTPPAVNAYVASQGVPTKITTQLKLAPQPLWTVLPTTSVGVTCIPSQGLTVDALPLLVNSHLAQSSSWGNSSLSGALNPKVINAREFQFKTDLFSQEQMGDSSMKGPIDMSKKTSEKNVKQRESHGKKSEKKLQLTSLSITEPGSTSKVTGPPQETKNSGTQTDHQQMNLSTKLADSVHGKGKCIAPITVSQVIAPVAAIRNLTTFPYGQQMLMSNGVRIDAIQCNRSCGNLSDAAVNKASNGTSVSKSPLVNLRSVGEKQGTPVTLNNIPSKFNKATKQSLQGKRKVLGHHVPDQHTKRLKLSEWPTGTQMRSLPSSEYLKDLLEEQQINKQEVLPTKRKDESKLCDPLSFFQVSKNLMKDQEESDVHKKLENQPLNLTEYSKPKPLDKGSFIDHHDHSFKINQVLPNRKTSITEDCNLGDKPPLQQLSMHNNERPTTEYACESLNVPTEEENASRHSFQPQIKLCLKKKWKFFKGSRKRKRVKSQNEEATREIVSDFMEEP